MSTLLLCVPGQLLKLQHPSRLLLSPRPQLLLLPAAVAAPLHQVLLHPPVFQSGTTGPPHSS